MSTPEATASAITRGSLTLAYRHGYDCARQGRPLSPPYFDDHSNSLWINGWVDGSSAVRAELYPIAR